MDKQEINKDITWRDKKETIKGQKKSPAISRWEVDNSIPLSEKSASFMH